MAKAFFALVTAVFSATAFIFYFSVNDFTPESMVVFFIFMPLAVAAIGVFVWKNRRRLNALTQEPSRRNVEVFTNLLSRGRKQR